ncbi:MAG: prephenate dehydratase domain-containing protein [bacterium]
MKKLNHKIYYLGPKGSYTEQAAKQFFAPQSPSARLRRSGGEMVEVFSIYQILEKIAQESPNGRLLRSGTEQRVGSATSPNLPVAERLRQSGEDKNSFGVAPVENSSEGALKIVLDTVIEKKLKIIGEVYLPISHCLLSKEKDLKNIKTIYSHPQGLAQSGDWIRENMPWAKTKETESTSSAAQIVSKEKQSAAIASEYCAKSYKLNILAKQLEENPNNYTRFWVLGSEIIKRKTNDKITVFICLNDRVAALRDLLNIFAKYNINLSKIESLALKGQAWRYGFLIDFFGNVQEQNIKSALKEIERDVAVLQILGQYQNQQHPDKTIEYFVNYLQSLFKQNKKFAEIKNAKIKNLDLLDKLLQTRLLLIPSVALYKYLNKIPKDKIYQPAREKEIIKKRLEQIKKKNIGSAELLIKLAGQNLHLSKEIQKTIYEMFAEKMIDLNQIKNIKLNKLRDLLDQIDENFDEALASLPKERQRKRLGELLIPLSF